jgi:DnaK suppressor protein
VKKKVVIQKKSAKSKSPMHRGKSSGAKGGLPKIPDIMRRASQALASQILGGSGIDPYFPGKTEKYMSEGMQEHFRKILLTWKKQLMTEADRTMSHMKDEAANYPDVSDRATQEEEFSLELRARDRERKLIKKIDESLAQLEESNYGYCEVCGVEIGLRRLEARPTATLCIDCKTLDEIREKQQGQT